ncbi:hypothetical protein ACBJ59_57050 [Nonomuraea sp. MTCD27]|uniref:hypothetical protein n=1 Tax=Nonomuraea sp. MTCD27 TaxID=1676747 RepID=UPI0035C0B8A8
MSRDQHTAQLTGLEIAMQWTKLPPEHLRAALKALEPQLVRDHAYRMALAEIQERNDERSHRLFMTGLLIGCGVAVAMLVAAVIVGMNGHAWLALAFSGPSMLALVGMFVLRRFDTATLRESRRAQPAQPADPLQQGQAPEPGTPLVS